MNIKNVRLFLVLLATLPMLTVSCEKSENDGKYSGNMKLEEKNLFGSWQFDTTSTFQFWNQTVRFIEKDRVMDFPALHPDIDSIEYRWSLDGNTIKAVGVIPDSYVRENVNLVVKRFDRVYYTDEDTGDTTSIYDRITVEANVTKTEIGAVEDVWGFSGTMWQRRK